jgi:hypothetical protein
LTGGARGSSFGLHLLTNKIKDDVPDDLTILLSERALCSQEIEQLALLLIKSNFDLYRSRTRTTYLRHMPPHRSALTTKR